MRVNVGIPVWCLSDEHLRAEEQEIAMLPGFYNKVWKGKTNIPQEFTLGQGHISFFMNKKTWSLNRYRLLHEECIKRGFNMSDKSSRWKTWFPKEDINYIETGKEKSLLIDRISERISNSNGYFHYYRTNVSKDFVINALKLA